MSAGVRLLVQINLGSCGNYKVAKYGTARYLLLEKQFFFSLFFCRTRLVGKSYVLYQHKVAVVTNVFSC